MRIRARSSRKPLFCASVLERRPNCARIGPDCPKRKSGPRTVFAGVCDWPTSASSRQLQQHACLMEGEADYRPDAGGTAPMTHSCCSGTLGKSPYSTRAGSPPDSLPCHNPFAAEQRMFFARAGTMVWGLVIVRPGESSVRGRQAISGTVRAIWREESATDRRHLMRLSFAVPYRGDERGKDNSMGVLMAKVPDNGREFFHRHSHRGGQTFKKLPDTVTKAACPHCRQLT